MYFSFIYKSTNFIISDVLAKGLMTGQSERMLFTPYRRKSDEPEEEKVKDETEVKGDTEEQEPEPVEEPQMTHEWFNMVCYGLPNLLVMQLGKYFDIVAMQSYFQLL
jgi:hypothetical protein